MNPFRGFLGVDPGLLSVDKFHEKKKRPLLRAFQLGRSKVLFALGKQLDPVGGGELFEDGGGVLFDGAF